MSDKFPTNLQSMKLFSNDRRAVILTDNKTVFRYISAGYREETETLYKSGLIDSLVAKGLLQPGKLKETGTTDYPLVIEHPFIQRLSYPFEWPASALKDVALTILEIEEIANGYGYTLSDPGPFNAAIQNSRPVYLDYDSIVPIEETPIWSGFDGFRDYILLPLEFYEKKFHYIARSILRDAGNHYPDQNTRRLVSDKFQRGLLDRLVLGISKRGESVSDSSIRKFMITCIDKTLGNRLLRKILESANYKVRPAIEDGNVSGETKRMDTRHLKALGSRANFLKELRKKVESLSVCEGSSDRARNYKNIVKSMPSWEDSDDIWTKKEKSFRDIMRKINPETALVIGDDKGWYSLSLAHNGASVITFERDEESINQLYSYVSHEHIDVLPLMIDIRQPTPEYEVNIGTILAATKRCKSEFVIVLNIRNPMADKLRVMVGSQIVKIEQLAHWLDMFTVRYLLIEFVPIDHSRAETRSISEEQWNIEVLKGAFSKGFDFQGCRESYPEGRQLLLFNKRMVEELEV